MMKKKITSALLAASMFVGASAGMQAAQAETLDYYLVQGVSYNQSVLKPAEIFKHDIGDQPIRHDLFVDYIRKLGAASDRLSVETIGYSHENRPILFITATHPDNRANLDAIKEAHLKRTNSATADEASDDLPVVTWMNYGVHGAEASGMDAAIPTLYHLAAAEDETTINTLKNSVIVITAVFNPDGHSRRASWVTTYGSDLRATDPAHDIHATIWPGARTNHYWFDLNRQWLLQTQPESQAWLKKWHEWKPEVSADFHEMGTNSTYYFHPGVPTRKYPMIPARGRELAVEISGYHAAALDKDKELYFAEEGFDNFYIGKGSTYPQVNGGVGILFEAGAQMGIAKESNQGLKTYANNIRNHFRTSVSTITGAAAMRTKLHAYQKDFFKSTADLARKDDVKGYVFNAPEDPTRLNKFIELLGRHDVTVNHVSGSIKAGGRTFGEDAFVVDLNQSQYRMAKALFNQITEFPDKVFYDVSGWTLPHAYGIDFAAVTSNLRSKKGEEASATFPSAQAPDVAPYAYMFRWSDYYAPRAANRLLQAGVLVRAAKKPVSVLTTRGEVSLDRGAVIVSLDNQTVSAEEIHKLVSEAASTDGITVHAVTSGYTPTVGVDLGGRDSVADMKAPRTLMVIGDGINAYDAGEVWHQMDHRMNMPITLVRKSRLSRVDWNRYTHLVLVGGRGKYSMPERADRKILDWVKAGGTIVGSRQGAAWVAENILGRKLEKTSIDKPKERQTYDTKGQKDAEHVIGGAVFASALDITHPMAFGYVRDTVATNRNTTIILPKPKDIYARIAIYKDEPLLSGYASPERLEQIEGTPMMTAERLGSGSVILFADNPNFRASYLGAEKLFLNAFFMSKAFSSARMSEEADALADEMDAHSH